MECLRFLKIISRGERIGIAFFRFIIRRAGGIRVSGCSREFEHRVETFRFSFTFLEWKMKIVSSRWAMLYLFLRCLFLFFVFGQFMCVGQIIHSNSQEDIQQSIYAKSPNANECKRDERLTIAEEKKNDEIEGIDHPFAICSSLRNDAIVHNLIPIFTCEDLSRIIGNRTRDSSSQNTYLKDSDQCGGELIEIL